jgi:predicted  nucleic acid-binding Zn-ribbon protein
VHKQINVLADLQRIDLKLDGIQGERQGIEAQIQEIEAKLSKGQSELAIRREEWSELLAEKQGLEASVATEQENITRSELRLKEIKTQKEYQAVSKEVSMAKKMLTELEEQISAKDAAIAQLQEALTTQEANVEEMAGHVATRADELRADISQLESAVAGDVAERDKVAKSLPSSLIRRYTLLREQRRGLAVVEARDGACQGCYMNIPPQLYNNLHRGDELIACPHCQRMLFIAPPAAEG